MDLERWAEIEALFHGALERPPDGRAAFLEEACSGDQDLRRRVEALLAAEDDADERLEGVVRETLQRASSDQELPAARQRIGPYEVLREIGRGGSGTVFLARRADEQYDLQVAIKVVHRGLEALDLSERLRRERQILAGLDHPNIARFLEGGTTEDGLPYVVMQYIEGEPIDRYCETAGLSLERRIELFRQVCGAVHYAHRNLIIHRDLKPANILVTHGGVPKLLDFGIAKLLGPNDGPPLSRTMTGLRLLTPEFASPEQILGKPLGTATDVYSLGVLLYLLLTGRLPHRLRSVRAAELEREICETPPPRPSMALQRQAEGGGDPKRLRRRLRGDIDNILLMALRKEPDRRYTSAEQLSEDLRRHLRGLPVLARADTLGYRSRKFLRRHRLPLAATVMVLAVIAALITFYTQRLTRERDRARQEAAQKEGALDYLTGLFELSDPDTSKGETITARAILDRGVGRLDQLGDQPEVQAMMQGVTGKVYRSLALYEQAEPLLQASLDNRRRLFGGQHPEYASALQELATLRQEQGEHQEAEKLLREALEIRRRAWREDRPEIGENLNDLAVALFYQRRFDEAAPLYREALRLQQRHLGAEHEKTTLTESNLAALSFALGDLDASEERFRSVLAVQRRREGDDSLAALRTMGNLATVLEAKGDYEGARPLYQEVLALRRQILGEEHPRVALTLNNLATVHYNLRQADPAEDYYRRALAIQDSVLGPGHEETLATVRNLANLLFYLRRDYEAAQRYYQRELEVQRTRTDASPEPAPSELASPLIRLADIALRRGHEEEAEAGLREALDILRAGSPEHWQIAEAKSLLGECLARRGRIDDAEALLRESVPALRQSLGDNREETRRARERLEALYHLRAESPDPERLRGSGDLRPD